VSVLAFDLLPSIPLISTRNAPKNIFPMHHSITTIEIERTTSLNPKINLKKIRAVSAGAGGVGSFMGLAHLFNKL
jgi:hypothetical protein